MTAAKIEKRPWVLEALQLWNAKPEWQQADDLAWAAGLIDGEGCIGVQAGKLRSRVVLRVVMTQPEAVLRLFTIFPFSPVGHQKARGRRLSTHIWTCSHQGYVGYVLVMLRRHLTVKRREADAAIEYLGLYEPTPEQNAEFSKVMRAGKTKGQHAR